MTARDAYDPFGKRRFANGNYDAAGTLVIDWSPTVNSGTDRGFTGHEQLDDIGLTHMNGRMYDASIGRFLSVDRAVTQPYELQSYNRYSYVENRPLNSTDPSGWNPNELTQKKWNWPLPLPDPDQHPSQPLPPQPKPQEMKKVEITGSGAVNTGCTGACLTVLRAEIDKYNKRMLAGGYVRSLMGGSLVMQAPKPMVFRIPGGPAGPIYAVFAGATLILVQEAATTVPGSNTMAGPYGFLQQAADGLSTGATTTATAAVSAKAARDREQWLNFYHGTDRDSALALAGGAPLLVETAISKHVDGGIGFYLADNPAAAEFFAWRRGGAGNPPAVLPFGVTVFAYDALIGAGAGFRPIPQGTGGRIPGSELFIPPSAFPLFETLRKEGQIRP